MDLPEIVGNAFRRPQLLLFSFILETGNVCGAFLARIFDRPTIIKNINQKSPVRAVQGGYSHNPK
jgi:hypothetical protein